MDILERMHKHFITMRARFRRWQGIISVLAAAIVFTVTYALVLPAITLDSNTASTQPGIDIAAGEVQMEKSGEAFAAVEEAEEEQEEPMAEEPAAEENSGSGETAQEAEEESEEPAEQEQDADVPSNNEEEDESGEAEADEADAGSTADAEPTEEEILEDPSALPENAAEAMTEMPAEEIELITEKTELTFRDENYEYTIYATFDGEARLPVGTELTVQEITKETDKEAQKAYADMAVRKVRELYDENTGLSFVKLYDISFMYGGVKIEPSAPVDLRIDYTEEFSYTEETAAEEAALLVLRLDPEEEEEEKKAVQLDTELKESDRAVKAIAFTSDKLPVFAVAATEKLLAEELTASGDDYEIRVTFGKSAGIPANAELEIREIVEGTEEYEAYRAKVQAAVSAEAEAEQAADAEAEQAADAAPETEVAEGEAQEPVLQSVRMVEYARFFDVKIVADGQEIKPASTVKVEINLRDRNTEDEELTYNALRITGEDTENLNAEVGSSISFDTDGL